MKKMQENGFEPHGYKPKQGNGQKIDYYKDQQGNIYYVYRMFYSYLLKLTEWLMLVISGIEFTTCFKNMPMQRTIPENITAAKAIVKIVIIIINLFKIYYLLFLKHECKVNTFLSNNSIFCREISLQYVFLDMGQPLVFSLENDILLSDILFLWQ